MAGIVATTSLENITCKTRIIDCSGKLAIIFVIVMD